MGYIFRSTGASDETFGATLTPGAPAGLTDGDLMLLTTFNRASAETITALTGWTELYFQNISNVSTYIYAHIADGINDAPTVTWTGGSLKSAWMEAFSGDVYTTLGSIVDTTNSQTVTSANLALPTLNAPSVANCLVYAVNCKKKTVTSDDATNVTFTPELTQTHEDFHNAGSGFITAGGYWIQTTATAYDGDNWTVNGSIESQQQESVLLALLSASGSAANPKGPFGLPLHGPFSGPI